MSERGGADEVLAQAVGEFVQRLQPIVLEWPEAKGADPDAVAKGLLEEARRLAAAFLCADGRLGDRELLAFRRSFGALDPEIANGPLSQLRAGDVVKRDALFTKQPSALFLQLLAMDRELLTGHAWTYYEAALGVGHA